MSARLDGTPGKTSAGVYVIAVVTVTYLTIFTLQLGTGLQDVEAEDPSEHSHPQPAEAVTPDRLAAFSKAAFCMPAVFVRFCVPYWAPAFAAADSSMAT